MINYTYTDKFIRILIYSILSVYLHNYFSKIYVSKKTSFRSVLRNTYNNERYRFKMETMHH